MPEWIRRLLMRQEARPAAPVPPPDPRVAKEQERHRVLLNRADKVLHQAMAHADQVFVPPYRGPERRHQPR